MIDSKAMRKVHEQNKELAFVFSNQAGISIAFAFQTRVLFKLA